MDGLNDDDLMPGFDIILEETNLSKIIIDNANVIINIWSLEGELLKFNNCAQKLTGFSEDEVLGHKWRGKFVTEELCPGINRLFEMFRKRQVLPKNEGKIYTKDKRILDILWVNYVVSSEDGTSCYGVSVGLNITESKNSQRELEKSYLQLKETQEALEKLALFDKLTGLPNAAYFQKEIDEKLQEYRKKGSTFTLLLMDLDNFKNINDTLGHSIGDKLLKSVSSRLVETIDCSYFFARFGGDEFVFLLDEVGSNSEVKSFAEDIINIVSRSIDIDNYELNVTASIGAAIFPEGGYNSEELFKNADIALNRSKELGKNQYCIYSQELNARIIEKAQIEQDLRKALDNNEFEIYYQPQIDAITGELTGAEALLRWIHPQKGIISPVKFIPVAEETGVINIIGEWVLRNACLQVKKWKDKGCKNLNISVNLSLKQLHDKDIVSKISSIVKETDIEPGYLTLEITESIAMHDIISVVKLLTELRKLGVSIALDDFGTGYSSLNYLTLLPINSVKLDKAFVDDVVEKHEKQVVAKAIIDLAHNLKLSVTAEGVETKEQLEMMLNYQCNLIQGYYFSKPLSLKEFEERYYSAV